PSPGRGGSSTHRADTGMVWQDLASELLFLPQTRSRNNREQLHFHAPGNDMDDDDATSFQERDAGHSGRRTAPGKRSGTSAAVQESARREHFSQHRGLQSGAATDAGGSGPPPCPAKLRATPRDPVGERMRDRLFLLDGSSIQLMHTPALLKVYPTAENQHGESHWPVMRVVVMHHVVTALAIAPQFGLMYGEEAVSEQ